MGNDSTKEKAKIEYLSHCHRRGPQGDVCNNGQWYDDIIKALSTNYPTGSTIVLRQHLKCVVRRIDITWLQLRFIITWYCNFLVYSINRVRKYIKRCRFQCLNYELRYIIKLIETCKDNLAFKYLTLISLFHQVLSSFSEVAIEGLFVSS